MSLSVQRDRHDGGIALGSDQAAAPIRSAFFACQTWIRNAGNQKSINLSRHVFIDELFPAAPEIAANISQGGVPKPFHLPLTI